MKEVQNSFSSSSSCSSLHSSLFQSLPTSDSLSKRLSEHPPIRRRHLTLYPQHSLFNIPTELERKQEPLLQHYIPEGALNQTTKEEYHQRFHNGSAGYYDLHDMGHYITSFPSCILLSSSSLTIFRLLLPPLPLLSSSSSSSFAPSFSHTSVLLFFSSFSSSSLQQSFKTLHFHLHKDLVLQNFVPCQLHVTTQTNVFYAPETMQ
jgi:hypothetical protein